MTSIKFCGLTREQDAAFAAELGASHAGVIFAASPRQVTAKQARQIFDAAGPDVKRVGVFASASLDDIKTVTREVRLDAVQLHGASCLSLYKDLKTVFQGEAWAVVPVGLGSAAQKALAQMCDHADAALLDTLVSDRTGGTGQVFAWETMADAVAAAKQKIRVFVAGGLNPQNVSAAITLLRPDLVDVSSGVESSPGVKDHDLMRAFAEAVHSASIV
ncbi:MAG: phosphoribosylanthranilate isomerase [Thermoanaerobaculia bacterium]